MKKRILTRVLAIVLCGSMLTMTSCIGSFSLTNRLLGWNQHVGNKFVNELVFFAFWILPVYEVSCLADLLVLNSIEFWSGSNPMAKGDKIIEGNDGKYLVTSTRTLRLGATQLTAKPTTSLHSSTTPTSRCPSAKATTRYSNSPMPASTPTSR